MAPAAPFRVLGGEDSDGGSNRRTQTVAGTAVPVAVARHGESREQQREQEQGDTMLTLDQIIEREGRIRQARRLIAEARQSLRQAPSASSYDGMRIGSVQRHLEAALEMLEDITVLDDGGDEIDEAA